MSKPIIRHLFGAVLVVGIASTIGTLAGCTAQQVANTGATIQTDAAGVFAAGQLFCSMETVAGPLTVALVNAASAGTAVTVTGLASNYVAALCQAWNAAAIPVTPPATTVPTVAIVAPPPTPPVAAPAKT